MADQKSRPQDKSRNQRKSDDQRSDDQERSGDLFWAVIAAAMFGVPTIILGSATTAWADATGWLLDHRVLVPATADPVVGLPATDGAGLDWARIAIAAGVLLILTLLIRLVSALVLAGASRRP
jgi:hypothetical protein